MKILHILILLFLFSFVTINGFTQEEDSKAKLRFLVGGAMEFGGDEVAEVYFTNGDTQLVNAGQGISIAVGGELQFPKVEQLLLRATVGYKYVTTQADNAHIRLTRVPLNFTANWLIAEKLRMGAGLAIHTNINFNADDIGQDITFKNATGPIFEIAYRGVGISYTVMKYVDQADISYSANAFGIIVSGVFPKR